MKELLHVKSDATQLKSDVVKIDTDLRGKLISREKKIINYTVGQKVEKSPK